MRRPVPHLWIRALALVSWAALGGACSGSGSSNAGGIVVGEPLPDIALSGERPALVWVVGVEQCLGCELGDAAWTVRSLQRQFGGRIETVVVAVGEGREEDRKLVSDFLASQRVSAGVELRTTKRYLRHYGPTPLSVFYLVNRRAVVEAVIAADSARFRRSADGRGQSIADLVESIANDEVESGEGSGMRQ
ncbi:MAG: hypothetical protein OXU69_05515 [Gemmatimonadota bacterium]|nr:hypothetical protein [Gemmatimonadota bacterium]MDE2984146.1 hypothetical protein [Gemmatimonadota bacterium]